jgi:hypothetical protein
MVQGAEGAILADGAGAPVGLDNTPTPATAQSLGDTLGQALSALADGLRLVKGTANQIDVAFDNVERSMTLSLRRTSPPPARPSSPPCGPASCAATARPPSPLAQAPAMPPPWSTSSTARTSPSGWTSPPAPPRVWTNHLRGHLCRGLRRAQAAHRVPRAAQPPRLGPAEHRQQGRGGGSGLHHRRQAGGAGRHHSPAGSHQLFLGGLHRRAP